MSFTSTTSRNDYIGNGSTDTYSYTFRIFANTDLLVTTRDTDNVETELTLTTDYTVTGVGDAGGGSITLVAGNLTTDYAISIRRVRPLTQTTDIRNQGDFYPETHEDVFDHIVMISQQQQDELDRTAKLSETTSPVSFDPTIPSSLVGEENRVMMTNQAGDAFALGPSAGEIAAANPYTLFRGYTEIDDTDSPYTIGVADTGKVFLCDCSSGAITLNLVEITTLTNQGAIAFKKTDSSNNALTINRGGSDTIESNTSLSITSPDTGFILVSTTGDIDWRVVGKFYSVVNAYGLFRTYASYVFGDSPVTLNNESSGLLVRCDASGGVISITLPQISAMTTMGPIAFKKTDSSTNAVTINRAGSDTVDGGTSYSLSYPDTTIILVPNSDDSAWVVTGNIYGDNPIFEATGSMTIPRGTTAQRPGTGVDGMMRYNSDITNFEGYKGSAWGVLGGGGSGTGINYCSNTGGETSTVGWAAYADAAGVTPVDGTGGSPNSVFSRVVADSLRGIAHHRFAKDAANRQGEGFVYSFTIDKADQGRMINVSLDYSTSANYVADDMHVWIYDASNSALIPMTPYKLEGTSDNLNHKFNGVFQSAIDSTSYRLIFHVSTTNALAYNFDFDNVQIGPQIKAFGPAVSDWKSFTPTGSWSSNTTYTGLWRRVGDSMEVQVNLVMSSPPDSTGLYVNMPSGFEIDTSKVVRTDANEYKIGYGSAQDTGGMAYPLDVRYNSSTQVIVQNYLDDTGASSLYVGRAQVTDIAPLIFTTDDSVSLFWRVPISGWSSNVDMSDDAETRVVACEYTKAVGNHSSTGNIQDITGVTLVKDTHNKMNPSTGVFTVPIAGWYVATCSLVWNSVNASESQVFAYHGSIAKGFTARVSIANNSRVGTASFCAYCAAGETIKFGAYQNTGGDFAYSSSTYMSIHRLSGPAQIAASEFIGARYTSNNGDGLTSAAAEVICYEDKDYDTHGIVTFTDFATQDFKATAPVAGYYAIDASILIADSANWTAGEFAVIDLFVNTTQTKSQRHEAESATTVFVQLSVSDTLYLNAGDYIVIKVTQSSGGDINMHNDGLWNIFSMKKVN